MKKFCLFLLPLVILLTNSCASLQSNSKVHPSDKKVLIVAHRGDWRNFADNALEGIESCIAMGLDIVEIDVARTKDGKLILMHDRTVDRTTNGKGKVEDLTWEEVKKLRLRNGLGRVTDYRIPSLEEAMSLAKGKIKVNLDKADQYFAEVFQILEKTGTVEQTIIKSDKPYQLLRQKHGPNLDKMIFMPIINVNKSNNQAAIDSLLDAKYPYYEIVFAQKNVEKLQHIKQKAQANQSVIWINSLWESLSAGYTDDKAVLDPAGNWGYLIEDLGAGIIQTDRPELLMKYLKEHKLH